MSRSFYALLVWILEEKEKDKLFTDRSDTATNIRSDSTPLSPISSLKRVDEYTRSPLKMELDLAPGGRMDMVSITPLEVVQASESDGQDQQ